MKHIIPVVSGKGGVGKSTVAVNLAIAMANSGAKVALIDSDFYGPSIPTLMGGGQVIASHDERLIPPEKFGVKYISLGFFLPDPDSAVIWRGPMFNKALNQLFGDVNWGVVDYCIVDMPPGTGDAQISLAQNMKLSGAVVVTTPQEVALADVRKSINMLSKVNVRVLGIVENMSGYIGSDGKRIDIFGAGGGAQLAKQFGVPLMGTIPIDVSIREGGDRGTPVAADRESVLAKSFDQIAVRVMEAVEDEPKVNVKIVN